MRTSTNLSHGLKSTLGKILKIKFLDKCDKIPSFPVTIGNLFVIFIKAVRLQYGFCVVRGFLSVRKGMWALKVILNLEEKTHELALRKMSPFIIDINFKYGIIYILKHILT